MRLCCGSCSASGPTGQRTVYGLIHSLGTGNLHVSTMNVRDRGNFSCPSCTRCRGDVRTFTNRNIGIVLARLSVGVLPGPRKFNNTRVDRGFRLRGGCGPCIGKLGGGTRGLFGRHCLSLFGVMRHRGSIVDHIAF